MRTLFRLGMLGLAGYGVKALYDRYGSRLQALRGPAEEFADRAASSTRDLAGDVDAAAGRVASGAKDTAADLRRAADDTTDEMKRRMTAPHTS